MKNCEEDEIIICNVASSLKESGKTRFNDWKNIVHCPTFSLGRVDPLSGWQTPCPAGARALKMRDTHLVPNSREPIAANKYSMRVYLVGLCQQRYKNSS